MDKIAVVILNWNGRALLERYLPGVVAHSDPHPVYILDNSSSDDSKEYVVSNFPQVQWIQTGENLGYAGGYNKGLASIHEPYAVLLNSDVRTTPGWLNPIADHVHHPPD